LEQLLANINSLPETIRKAVRNHGGGHWNHTFFWNIMSPSQGRPEGRLKEAMISKWQTLETFTDEFSKAAMSVFGSGWAWVIADGNGKLHLATTPNQDNPLMDIVSERGKPILGIDVWEHAYYLRHQNVRANYIKDFLSVLNWNQAMANYG
jgi:Fe-Mn family superoxide dismutase